MEEKKISLTACEMDFIVNIIKQISISPTHQDAASIVWASQSILGKIQKACRDGEGESCQQESTI